MESTSRCMASSKLNWRNSEGEWVPFSSTAAMKKRSEDNETRQALQAKIQEMISGLLVDGPQPAFLARFVDPR